MSLRGLEKFSKSSPQDAQIANLILAKFNNDLGEADKFWMRFVVRCLWTKEIWGDRDAAEQAAAGLILRAIYTEDELKAAGINLGE
jgi:hypothetical protein